MQPRRSTCSLIAMLLRSRSRKHSVLSQETMSPVSPRLLRAGRGDVLGQLWIATATCDVP